MKTKEVNMNVVAQTLESVISDTDKELDTIGIQIGKLYTNNGLPIDMALTRLPHSKEQKIAILTGALGWVIEHKRQSGATEKAVERTRESNRAILMRFIETGEAGAY